MDWFETFRDYKVKIGVAWIFFEFLDGSRVGIINVENRKESFRKNVSGKVALEKNMGDAPHIKEHGIKISTNSEWCTIVKKRMNELVMYYCTYYIINYTVYEYTQQ